MYGNYTPYNYGTPNYTPQVTQDERIWVQNEASAEAYLVAPNSFVRLWDSTRPVFYEKRADATGRPMPIEAYEYAKMKPKEAEPINDYQKEIDSILRRIEALEKERDEHKSDADDTTV